MKIQSVRAQVVRIPLNEPLAGGPAYSRTHNQFVTVRVETGDLQGIGVSFMGGMLSASLKHAIEQLGGLIVGEDPLRIEALANKLRTTGASAGPGGILTLFLEPSMDGTCNSPPNVAVVIGIGTRQ